MNALADAVKRRKAVTPAPESDQILQMILEQVTKMASQLSEDKIVTTQESRVP